jgi:hypothetical protein
MGHVCTVNSVYVSGLRWCFQMKANRRSPSKRCLRPLSELGFAADRGRKIALHALAGFLSCLLLASVTLGFPQTTKSNKAQPADPSIAGTVTVIVRQGQANGLAGVTVSLSSQEPGSVSQSTVTDDEGRYQFKQLVAGTYRLEVNHEGFQPWVHVIVLGQGDSLVENVPLLINGLAQEIEVQAQTPEILTQSAEPAATVTGAQAETLPLREERFRSALPLVPGVVRTEDGKLNIKGAPENQGMLLVDSAENVDPVTGSFSVPIPLDAIEKLSVSKAAYSAEYGGFSGGLTEIQTKAPSDGWQYGIYDFIPGFRGKNGHLQGLSAETPRLYFGGPLLKNKLNFSEAVTYDFKRIPVRGLAWPNNETIRRGWDTLTSFQATLSPQHVLNVNLNAFSNWQQFANINALLPQPASSDDGQRGISVGVSDSYAFGSGTLLSTIFRYTRFDSTSHGQGPQDLLITPEGWAGNFFNSWARTSNQFEVLPTLQLPLKAWHGHHEFKVGVDLTHRSFDGITTSHPIQVLRQDGLLAEQIDFQGAGNLRGSDTEISEFIQDHWTVNNNLAFDLGARLLSQSAGRAAAFAPRAEVTYSPGSDHKTVIRVGTGLFYDRVPLLATDFTANPTRNVSYFDASGKLTGPPIPFQNVYLQDVAGAGLVPTDRIPNITARNHTSNVEMDRELSHAVALRVSYLYSETRDIAVVTPLFGLSGGGSFLGLANTGRSHYHEFEATLHYQLDEHKEFTVSYVRSHARGDLNTLSDIFVPFEQPVIRPNVISTLAADIPNRVVAWGGLSLPLLLILNPVVDVHSGLPFSVVDANQNYVGTPNSQRFPYFFSFDFKIYREFKLPFLSSHKNRKLRLGIYSLNVTNHSNPRDVFNNITSPRFGQLTGFQHRVDGFVIDVVN